MSKKLKGLKTKKNTHSFFNQHEILGGKGCIFNRTEDSKVWYFRMYLVKEKKYYRKSLKTEDYHEGIRLGEKECLKILQKLESGYTVFGKSFRVLCEEFLQHKTDESKIGMITSQRVETIKTQLKWLMRYFDKKYECEDARKGIHHLEKNTFIDYYKFRKLITDNKVEDITIKHEHSTINQIGKYCYDRDYLNFSLFNLKRIIIKEVGRRDSFEINEYRKLIEQLRDFIKNTNDEDEIYYRQMLRDFILILSNTCMRFGECRLLKWKDIKVLKDGNNTLEIVLRKEITKNRKERKVISNGGNYINRLKKYTKNHKPNDWVFCHKDKKQSSSEDVLSRNTLYKHWNKFLEFSKINEGNKHFSFYSLRHFGITEKLRNGVSVDLLSKMCGTGIKYIQNHYSHTDVSDDVFREELTRVNRKSTILK